MAHPLEGVRLKLDRAWEHLKHLNAETAGFFEAKPYEVGAKFEADVSEYILTVKPLRQPPLWLGVILGDLLHNLRSALDHLVCQLALTNGASGCETTQFPITSSSRNYRRKEPIWLSGVSKRHRARIELLQPYHAGADMGMHFLTILNKFNNVDKHRVVHPAFGYFVGFDPFPPTIHPNRDAGIAPIHIRLATEARIEGETEICRLMLAPTGPNPRMDVRGNLVFDPAFGETALRQSSLPQLLKNVRAIIESFAPDFG